MLCLARLVCLHLHAHVRLTPERLPCLLRQVVYNVCSGSEANELAWRLACAAARARGVTEPLHVAVMDHGELPQPGRLLSP